MKRALICGISGQDGAYLAQLLLAKGYEVWGTSRDAEVASFSNLITLGVREQVRLESMTLNDFRSVLQCLIKVQPDEVYNLSGQSSVALSFQQPMETLESISVGTMNLLEAIRFVDRPIRFYNAGSSECFGDTGGEPANEQTPFRPRSPYAMAKAAAFWQVSNYREAYGLFACSGILFNHESPLRHPRFVTRKVVDAACRIAAGSKERLALGDIAIVRDWGWAPEYVDAMWRMLQQERADDFVVATGRSFSLQEFVAAAFECYELDWQKHVVVDKRFSRPTEIKANYANPEKARKYLDWEAQSFMPDVVRMMVAARSGNADQSPVL